MDGLGERAGTHFAVGLFDVVLGRCLVYAEELCTKKYQYQFLRGKPRRVGKRRDIP